MRSILAYDRRFTSSAVLIGSSHPMKYMKRLIPLIAIAAVLVVLLLYSQRRTGPLVVSGFIEADEIRVGSRIGGRVAKVLVEEGQDVSAGETLIVLEPFDLQERLAEAEYARVQATAFYAKIASGFRPEQIAQAKARRDQIKAELDKLRNGPRPQEIAAAEAALQLAEAERELADTQYQRMESLFGRAAVSKSDLDEAATILSVAKATVATKQELLALLKEGTRAEEIRRGEAQLEEAEQQLKLQQNGYRDEEIQEARAKRDSAHAAVNAIQKQIEELKIVAPTDALVEAIELRPGDLVSANAPSVSLADNRRMWVRAYVPENHLNLQPGQKVDVQVDSFPGRRFAGEIIFIARHAEFTPGNIQTPEERSKQVFRIKVSLTEGLDVLRPGMAADVVLSDGGDRS